MGSGNVEFNGDINGSLNVQTSVVRSGTYALRVNNLVSGAQKRVTHQFVASNNTGSYWFRFYFRLTTAPSADNQICNIRNSSGVRLIFIVLNSSGALELWDEDGQIGSDSAALTTNTWYRVEIRTNGAGVGANDIVEAQIDGSVFATSSTRDLSTGVFNFSVGGNLNAEAQTQADWCFDDMAVNDSSGSFQNDYPGEGEIIHLRPNGVGDNSDWTGDYTSIDEVTPDDATTVITSNTLNQIEDVTLDDTPAAMDTTDVINCVQVGVHSSLDDATGADPNFVVRIKASPGGTVEESANLGPTSTVFTTWKPQAPRNPGLTLYDLPGASATAWTKADLDTAQIGVRETATDTHNVRVSTLWLLVDHKPGVAGPSSIIHSVLGDNEIHGAIFGGQVVH